MKWKHRHDGWRSKVEKVYGSGKLSKNCDLSTSQISELLKDMFVAQSFLKDFRFMKRTASVQTHMNTFEDYDIVTVKFQPPRKKSKIQQKNSTSFEAAKVHPE